MNKPCPECKAIMKLGRTTLHFERSGFYADVEDVEAYICPKCGTRTIAGNIAKDIGDTMELLFQSVKKTARLKEKTSFTGISFHKLTASKTSAR
ncbi:MAG TPA: YgiT-type zinc finger protein [Candidatus Brocadiia bacterium]|nr:YgiT-type zinc finger protein [Candidatus Brocadiales bacterium]